MQGSPLRRLVLPLAAAAVVLVPGCATAVPGTGTAPPGAGAPPGLEEFYGQQLSWGSCAPFAVTAGFSYAGNRNNAARVGVAGEF